MILLISAPYFNDNHLIRPIFMNLYDLGLDVLSSIEKIVSIVDMEEDVVDVKKSVEKTFKNKYDLCDKTRWSDPVPVPREYVEDEERFNVIKKLMLRMQIESTKALKSKRFLLELSTQEVYFYYPLFSPDLLESLKALPKVSGYFNYRYSGSAIRSDVVRIDIKRFFETAEIIERVKEKYLADITRGEHWGVSFRDSYIYKGKVEHPGSLYLSNSDKLNWLLYYTRQELLVGDYESCVSLVLEDQIDGLDNIDYGDVCYIELDKGLPLSLGEGYKFYIFINADKLTFQDQSNFLRLLAQYDFPDCRIILHANSRHLIPSIVSSFEEIRLNNLGSLQNNLSGIFIYFLHRYGMIENVLEFDPKMLKNNVFAYFLKGLQETKEMVEVLKTLKKYSEIAPSQKALRIFDPGFWYIIEEETRNAASSVNKESADAITQKDEYKFHFKGRFWEVSLGYSEPVLIEDTLGVYYLIYLLKNPGISKDITEIRKSISQRKVLVEHESALNSLREKGKLDKNYKHEVTYRSFSDALDVVYNSLYECEEAFGYDHALLNYIKDSIRKDGGNNVIYLPKLEIKWDGLSEIKSRESIKIIIKK